MSTKMKRKAFVPPDNELAAMSAQIVSADELAGSLQQLRESIERRAYEIFVGRGGEHGNDLEDWLRAEQEILTPIAVHMTESNGALTLRAEAPGFAPQEVKVSVESYRIIISAARQQEAQPSSIYVFRMIDLPVEVDPARTTASYRNGVLECVLPQAY